MTNPFAHMVAMLDERSVGHSRKSVLSLKSEFGTITKTGLKLDNFKHEIADYYLAMGLVLKEGDRVLCVPVDDGDDVAVICKVVKR